VGWSVGTSYIVWLHGLWAGVSVHHIVWLYGLWAGVSVHHILCGYMACELQTRDVKLNCVTCSVNLGGDRGCGVACRYIIECVVSWVVWCRVAL
jgi:hypothetical protein